MSWFSGNSVSTVELDNKISEATSESIPNGEIELSVALEITDLIRSKKIPAKQCMRSLKKRLTLVHANPNLLTSSLKLVDLCVKNSGYHFLVEIASKEFMDYVVDVLLKIHYNVKDYGIRNIESKLNVGNTILALIQEWAIMFENQLQLNYVDKCYKQLVNDGYKFPQREGSLHINSTFIDSEAPPDWVDSDLCMICYTPFSMINRKHHCRACGGVFCQTHSNNYIPLVSLGIKEPVRVCDNCHAKYKGKTPKTSGHSGHSRSRSLALSANPDDEDEELKRAIELSLRDSGVQEFKPPQEPPLAPPPQAQSEDDDEEMKAAIAASLKEFENQEKFNKQQSQPQQASAPAAAPAAPQSDFYSNILPFDANEQFGVNDQANHYNQYNPSQPQAYSQPPQHQQLAPQRTQVEDLTQQEEGQINLFITLMNTVKNDPKKRANILYDSNISELHTQVIRLKPKVNKSLRASIEKYETFLEMNNKISTIIKLYDQYLEDKLNMAYGNHHISSQPTAEGAPGHFFSEPSYQDKTGQLPSYNAYNGTSVAQQATGASNGYLSHQPTSEGAHFFSESSYQNNSELQPQGAYYDDYGRGGSLAPQPAPSLYAQGGHQQPSEPSFDDDEEEEDEEEEDKESQYAYQQPPPTTFGTNNRTNANLAYPVLYDGVNSQPPLQPPQQSQPSFYPPANYSPEITDNETDNERSDASTLTHQQPLSSLVRRQSSTLPAHAVEDATARFPTIETVENDYDKQHPNRTASNPPYPGASEQDLAQLPSLPDFGQGETRPAKYVAEPEPLIEL
ncbi:ubiquitin binding protein [Suhomyces tanzawaensis NRRL Y-17324]|uniref:Vacuolar protein sorting-associated protein 27 n=1 Tax=Suhomyces tanzawaensis NRRL Y-17324 TaxID=984487 RepID=A0A1E4SMQ7_9ASCO|nr:ubiquitin binding protein [Suhomyces tanzawaensis NRRL Y-17324]ODV80768.1 ubiquitin binding protein [Suhomyces tanzawaensis NRRL Y-17324]